MPDAAPGNPASHRAWPWAVLGVLLVTAIALFFVYTPRERGAAPVAESR